MKRIGLLLCTAMVTFSVMNCVAQAVEAPEEEPKPTPDVVKKEAPEYVNFDLAHLACVTTTKQATKERMEFIKNDRRDEVRRGDGAGHDGYVVEAGGNQEVNGGDGGDAESVGEDAGADPEPAGPVPELVEPADGDGCAEESEAGLTYLGDWYVTAYCSCPICCGDYATGYTASGTLATEGRTVACNSLPIGSQVMIDGWVYTVEDTGYSPYGDEWLDLFFESHDAALAWGAQVKEVYLID